MGELEFSDEEIERMFSSEDVPRRNLRIRHSEAKYLLGLIRSDIRKQGEWPIPDKWLILMRVHLGGELSRITKELKYGSTPLDPDCGTVDHPIRTEAIDDLIKDISTNSQALHKSKGGEPTMAGDKTKPRTRTVKKKVEEEEEQPTTMLDTALVTLKKDHNWKYFVGMAVYIILQQLIKGL